MFEARLIEPEDSTTIGGARYTNVGNNAQVGSSTQITIASNDTGTTAEYVGQRIILTSGVGTGQYGYIQAYDDSTKVATIYRETTDTIGWDHIIPGTPIESALSTNTQYRIEPRVVVGEPPFTVNSRTMPNTEISPQQWSDSAWGSTRQEFNNIVLSAGSGTTIDLTPEPAVVRVVKTGKTYTINLISNGVGYAVGDTTVIPGNQLDGATPTNDCTVRVTETSDDSTNSIVAVEATGLGYEGRWVAISESTYSAWSDDGISWTQIFTPYNAPWKTMAHGNDVFVAISNTVTDVIVYNRTGKQWVTTNLPSSAPLKDIHFADGKFVIICEDDNRVFYSTNGFWTQTSIHKHSR